MATSNSSLLFKAAEQSNAANQEEPKVDSPPEDQIESPRSRGRKPSKVPAQKKQPQRGMGVAQLERLRLQERWKKMTDITQVNALHVPNQFHSVPHLPFTTDSIGGVPVLHGGAYYAGPTIGGDGLLCLDPRMVAHRIGNGGFGGFYGGGSGCLMMDQGRVGTPGSDMRVQIETAKELPSIQTMLQQSGPDCFDACSKKKRSDGLDTGFNGSGKDQYGLSFFSSSKSCDFVGVDREKNAGTFNGDHFNGFGAVKSTKSPLFASRDSNEQVEVMAIHRKGNCDENGGSLVMEYEFFPGKTSEKIIKEKRGWPAEASVNAMSNGEASNHLTTSTASYANSSSDPATSIDLSLKL